MRYFLELSYVGTHYHGWQIQDNAASVQQELNEALSKILRTEIKTTGSGRTDTGVHAIQQVAHFDFEGKLENNLSDRLNSLLSKNIAIKSCRLVQDEVNARYDAKSRAYVYKIISHKNPFQDSMAYRYAKELNLDAMNEACELIKNWKDFESFSKVHTEVNNFNCEIFEAKWVATNEAYEFYVKANRFLRGMVRAMVGTLLLVSEGSVGISGFKKILESQDRTKAGRSVPAHGLYLSEVNYLEEIYQ
ncbi:MAG: tRNA pseudouridine(38-40) synthase TruA [Reichenbachiella sp.]